MGVSNLKSVSTDVSEQTGAPTVRLDQSGYPRLAETLLILIVESACRPAGQTACPIQPALAVRRPRERNSRRESAFGEIDDRSNFNLYQE